MPSYYPYTMSFQAESTLYQNRVTCHINENDFNYSMNPTCTNISGSLNDNVSGSDFTPYATTVGLYNERNELLVVGKFGSSIPIPRNTDMTIIVQWDS